MKMTIKIIKDKSRGFVISYARLYHAKLFEGMRACEYQKALLIVFINFIGFACKSCLNFTFTAFSLQHELKTSPSSFYLLVYFELQWERKEIEILLRDCVTEVETNYFIFNIANES